ncbi:MAG: hypothetical protein RH980_01970 [Roseovarius confluentis]|jgi:hypothetical protein
MFKYIVDIQKSEELIKGARAISAASPPIMPQYTRENAPPLDELDDNNDGEASTKL